MTEIYCGASKIPKDKRRGTAKECYKANQVRYYGIEQIPDSVLAKGKKKPVEELFFAQRLKVRKLEGRAQALYREAANELAIIRSDSAREKDKKGARKRLEPLRERGKRYAATLRKEQAILDDLKEQNKLRMKKEADKEKARLKEAKKKEVKKKSMSKAQIEKAATELARSKTKKRN